MKFTRRFTTADRPVAEQVEWKTVPAQIDRKTAQVAEVEVPAAWSQNAANIFADLYLRKAGVPVETTREKDADALPSWLQRSSAVPGTSTGSETSARQVFHRLCGAWTYHGWLGGYFGGYNRGRDFTAEMLAEAEEQARAFYDEVYWCLAAQLAAPNSPQFFNTGLWWAYDIEGPDTGMWRVDPGGLITDDGQPIPERVPNSYQYPQPHACFLTPTTDDLVNEGGIMDTWVREARIFKHGSGSGTNVSSWRARGERLSGGGVASGVMSWLKIGDAAAGAIQSGGNTRRAAVMRIMDADHPEVLDFVRWKVREEGKAAAMYVGSQLLRLYYEDVKKGVSRDRFVDVPQPVLDRLGNGFEPELLRAGFEEEAIASVDGQNSNNSIRVTDEFMALSARDPSTLNWPLTARTTGETMRTVNASEMWDEICRAAWACADPGLQFATTINEWNTCPNDGEIVSCNPCSEFQFLPATACNLASLRLTAFLRDDGSLDLDAYEYVCRLFTIILDISNSMASFPAREFALGAWNYRTIGLGYADLGGLLMRLALPYDSDEGRALAAGLTALMTGAAYLASAELAAELGPFPRFAANREPMLAIMRRHQEATHTVPMPLAIQTRAKKVWAQAVGCGFESGFRNAQTTLIAPTGTISLVMDCDTSGCEPDYALIKDKHLAGGGRMRIVNQAVPAALRRLGYIEPAVAEMVQHVADHGSLTGYNAASALTHDVFACVAELEPMAHVSMLAAIQPFLSGAASKSINLPNLATVEDVSRVYRAAHRLGVKAVALYRDGSKLTQPLAAAARPRKKLPVTGEQLYEALASGGDLRGRVAGHARGEREPLPPRRRGQTQKARVGGQTVYLRTGEYADGRLGELFIDLAGAGSTLDGFASSLAKMTSIALQFGAPVAEVVDALHGVRFEPAGHVELHERIRWCESIPDLIARDLGIAYEGREDMANVVRAVPVGAGGEAVALDRRALAAATGVPTGERCAHCGGPLVQSGTCRTCVDCGRSSGGCG